MVFKEQYEGDFYDTAQSAYKMADAVLTYIRFKIANVLTPVYEGVHPREAEETRCNAHLIAAAPELLEALIKLTNYVSDDSPLRNTDEFDLAKAAIKKALGEEK